MPRVSLALAAALLMHVAVFSSARPSARSASATASVPVRAITVRAIPVAIPAEQTPRAGAEESPATPVRSEPATRVEPTVSIARAADPRPSAAPAAAAPSQPAAATPPARTAPTTAPAPATTTAGPKAEPAERVVALPAAPDYLLGATLDPGPIPIGDIEPEYPASANLQEGKVVIRLLISDTGKVDNVAVVRASPPGLFEVATLEAFGKAQFMPARAAGVAVKSQITVEVHFLPINRGSRISGRSY